MSIRVVILLIEMLPLALRRRDAILVLWTLYGMTWLHVDRL